SPGQVGIVFEEIDASTARVTGVAANTGAFSGAISVGGLFAALTYLLVEGGAREFNEAQWRRSLGMDPAGARAIVNATDAEGAPCDAWLEGSTTVRSDMGLTVAAERDAAVERDIRAVRGGD